MDIYPTWSRLDGLLVGVSIAALLQFKPVFSKKVLKYGNALLFVSALLFVIDYFFCSEAESFNASMFGFPLVDIGYGFIVLAALSPQCFLHKYQSGITSKIAALSYGIYLIHKIVIHVTQSQFIRFKIEDSSNIMFLICIATVFVLSLILNETIEKPFLKLRIKLLIKKKAEEVTGTAYS